MLCCNITNNWNLVLLILASLIISKNNSVAKILTYSDIIIENPSEFLNSFKISPSVTQWESLDTPGKFSIVSISVSHHSDSSWFLPALHEKYSIGWNRTINKGFLNRPYSCNIRLFGVALEKTLEGFQTGGTGYLTLGFENNLKKKYWHGFDKNETNKIYCYYITNKDTGSEFLVSVFLKYFCIFFYHYLYLIINYYSTIHRFIVFFQHNYLFIFIPVLL
jgi:hypothetical protein